MILAGAIIYDMPESPHVLVYWNRPEEALEVLARVRGKTIEDPDVVFTHNAIQEVVQLEKSVNQPIWRSLFWDNSEVSQRPSFMTIELKKCNCTQVRNSRRVFLIFWLQAFQQLGGNNVIVYVSFALDIVIIPKLSDGSYTVSNDPVP